MLRRNRIISVLMITCILLTGCGKKTEREQFENIRASIAQARTVTLDAAVTASFPDRTEEFTLHCVRESGDWVMTVTAPEQIAGVTARMSGTDSSIVYDDVILPTGDLTDCGIIPINVVPTALETLLDGYLSSSWTEKGGLAVKVIRDDTVAVTVWFDEEDVPRMAELAENGVVKASCTIENFTIEGSGNNGNTEETDMGGNTPGESGT